MQSRMKPVEREARGVPRSRLVLCKPVSGSSHLSVSLSSAPSIIHLTQHAVRDDVQIDEPAKLDPVMMTSTEHDRIDRKLYALVLVQAP